MRIPLPVWYGAMLVATLAFAMLPGFPPHGFGYVFFLLPVLHWFYFPARRARVALYVAGIALTLLAYPDPDLGFLGWFLFWPYLRARELDDGTKWWRGAVFFFFLRSLAGYYWLGNIHATAWLFVSISVALAITFLFEATLRFATFLPFALRGAIGWLIYEWFQSWCFGGFPWLYAGHTQYRFPALIQAADVVGVPGISFLVVFAGLALYRAVFAKRRVELAVAGALFVAALGYGLLTPSVVSETRARRKILLVQSAVPYSVKKRASQEGLLRELETLTLKGLRDHPEADLIVWPETLHPFWLVETMDRTDIHRHVRRFARRVQRPGIYGINSFPDMDRAKRWRGHNSALLVDKDGTMKGLYKKQRLVPMGEEFLPRRVLSEDTANAFMEWMVTSVGYPRSSDLLAGDEFVTLDAGPGLRCAMLICFEGLYAQDARAAIRVGEPDLILHLVNNGWFGASWEERQSVASWVFRAIETRTPFLSCANGGISCSIDASGRITAALDRVMEAGSLLAEVSNRGSPPPYARWSRWLLPGVLALVTGVFVVLRRKMRAGS